MTQNKHWQIKEVGSRNIKGMLTQAGRPRRMSSKRTRTDLKTGVAGDNVAVRQLTAKGFRDGEIEC